MQLAAWSHALPTKEYPTEIGVQTYIIAAVISGLLVPLAHAHALQSHVIKKRLKGQNLTRIPRVYVTHETHSCIYQ